MNTIDNETIASVNLNVRSLDAADRCDRCPQQAIAIAALDIGRDTPGEVLACGHHWRRHRPAVLAHPKLIGVVEPKNLDPYTFGPHQET